MVCVRFMNEAGGEVRDGWGEVSEVEKIGVEVRDVDIGARQNVLSRD